MDAKIPHTIGLGLHWQNRSILHDQSVIIDRVKQSKVE